jgi:hypothetical protein
MKYIVVKPANVFLIDNEGILRNTKKVISKKSILSGKILKMKVALPKGIIVEPFLSIEKGKFYIHAGAVTPYQSKGGDESLSFSGSEIVAKVGGADVLIPFALFGGLGFVIGSIIGESKVQLALGGAVIGGLIGLSGSDAGAKMMSAEGRRTKLVVSKPIGAPTGGGHNSQEQTMNVAYQNQIAERKTLIPKKAASPSDCEAWIYCKEDCGHLWKGCVGK